MAVERIAQIDRYQGASGDTKPASPADGSIFYETDTAKTYVFAGGSWVLAEEHIVLVNADGTTQINPAKEDGNLATLLATAGAIADAAVAAGAAGSLSAKLRRLTTDLDALKTSLDAVQQTNDAANAAKSLLVAGKSAAGKGVPILVSATGELAVTGVTLSATDVLLKSDARLRAIDNIIETISDENIRVFALLNEAAGSSTSYDLLRRSLIQFTVSGATMGSSGLLDVCPTFDGVNDYIIQKPTTEATVDNHTIPIDGATKIAAQKLVANSRGRVGFVRIKVKKTEAVAGNLNAATIQVAIHEDSAGAPAALAITNGTSTALAVSDLSTTARLRGLSFATAPELDATKTYWLCVSYATSTGVGAADYVSWQADSAGAYGQGRSFYDGATWTAYAGQDHVFDLFNDQTRLGEDYSIIFAAKDSGAAPGSRVPFTIGGMTSQSVSVEMTTAGAYQFRTFRDAGSSLTAINAVRSNWSEFNVFGLTYSKNKATAKASAYANGMLVGSVASTGGSAPTPAAGPLSIGAQASYGGTIGAFYNGLIAPFIITANELTSGQMAKVSHSLMVMRKYGGAV